MNKIWILIIILSVPMAACGVKPKSLDAPTDSKNIEFPKQYPQK